MRFFTNLILSMVVLYGIFHASIVWSTPPQSADAAGPYVIGNDKDRSRNLADARDFLWDHWREHRYGRLTVTWISKEGRPANTTYVIGKDERDVWSLSIETRWPPAKGGASEHAPVEHRAYSVRRIEARHDGQSSPVFLEDTDKRPGSTYSFIFLDEKGIETGGM